MKIAIIGTGNMGNAIVRGLVAGAQIDPLNIVCSDSSENALRKVKTFHAAIQTVSDNKTAVRGVDIVLLAVKPWLLEEVIYEIKPALDYEKQMIVSIAGGITFEQLDKFLCDRGKNAFPALFRLIPNTAIEVKQSMTFIASRNASQDQIKSIVNLFNKLGTTIVVDEKLMSAGTSLASCGIAYAFRYIRAATEGGVELGFYPEQAKNIVLQTLKGAVELLQANGNHPEAEIDKVTTPGGLTIRGLNEMENAGFTSSVIRGLKANQ